MIGKYIWAEFPEGIGKPFHIAYEQAVNRQEMVELEEYYPPWKKWFENRIYPSSDGVSIFFRDVTERKEAQAQFQKEERFNRLLIDTVPCAIAHVASDGAVLHVNAEAQRMLGFTYDEVTQKYVTDWSGKTIWEDGTPCLVEDYPVIKCLKTGQPQPPMTIGIYSKDGQLHWATFTAVPVLDSELERPGSVILAFLDVTQQKRDEVERKKLEAGLYHAQKMEAIGTLASGVAHNFNTHIHAILNHVEATREVNSTQIEVHQTLDKIGQAAYRACEIVDSLLTFAKGGGMHKSVVELADVVADAVELLRELFPANVEVRLSLPPQRQVWVLGNEVALQQVVINLALNARDAMPHGGILEIDLNIDSRNGTDEKTLSEAVLTFRDSGQGMSTEMLERIFEPFFTTKDRDKGTGLGLWMVHNIVTGHNGRIEAVSQPEQGCQFTVYLPLCSPPVDHETIAQPHFTHRVLVGQANDYLREIMASSLEDSGYRVVDAATTSAVIELSRTYEDEMSLVILDVDSLAPDDLSWFEQWRNNHPSWPLIVITADQRILNKPTWKDIQVITKPFQMARLLTSVAKLLDNGKTMINESP